MICDICMAAGGIGTVCTFVCMIYESKRKSKQIEVVQKIQSHQLESLYEPDIRIAYYGNGEGKDIIIKNYGEKLVILNVFEHNYSGLLNVEGMKNWFPHHLDKGESFHIPLIAHFAGIHGTNNIIVECRNRLGLEYKIKIGIVDGKVSINESIKKEL
jgi:hypothetical protein